MKWMYVKDRKPTKEDSPILAERGDEFGFTIAALEYLDDGWDGPGWYDHSKEYGMGLNEEEAHYHEFGNMIRWVNIKEIIE